MSGPHRRVPAGGVWSAQDARGEWLGKMSQPSEDSASFPTLQADLHHSLCRQESPVKGAPSTSTPATLEGCPFHTRIISSVSHVESGNLSQSPGPWKGRRIFQTAFGHRQVDAEDTGSAPPARAGGVRGCYTARKMNFHRMPSADALPHGEQLGVPTRLGLPGSANYLCSSVMCRFFLRHTPDFNGACNVLIRQSCPKCRR